MRKLTATRWENHSTARLASADDGKVVARCFPDVGENRKFTLNDFRELVKDGQKKHQHKNRLLNMAKDDLIHKLDKEGNLFCMLLTNLERCASNNHVR